MTPDVAASVRARLLNRARAEGEEFERTLVRFAAERFLYRLGASTARRLCVLKGASLLNVWLPDPYRVTRDVDMLASGPADEETLRALLEDVFSVSCPEDGLRFDLASLQVDVIRAREEYVGQRARFHAHLGTARIRVQVDFGFGDALAIAPEEVVVPTILERLPAPRLRAYPREVAIAEKLDAMVSLGIRNSRMKDFHDVWALSGQFAFDGPKLREAVATCLGRRGRTSVGDLPEALAPGFYASPSIAARWTAYIAAGGVLLPPPGRFDVVGDRVIAFLGPVYRSATEGTVFAFRWPAGGPWGSPPA